MIYAGIGSRQTPSIILYKMKQIAKYLSQQGHTLRSGGALGADLAFESGCTGKKEIFYASQSSEEAEILASHHHPNWNKCTPYVKNLHGRNMQILLGITLNKPVDFIVCWTPNGAITGGTGQALRYAECVHIQVYNLYYKQALIDLRSKFGIT